MLRDSDNSAGKGDTGNRRTSFSNRDKLTKEAKSGGSAAAESALPFTSCAQALNLETPTRSRFRAINAADGTGADAGTSWSACASLEPPSRADSVLRIGGDHSRVHARSSNQDPAAMANASSSIVRPPAFCLPAHVPGLRFGDISVLTTAIPNIALRSSSVNAQHTRASQESVFLGRLQNLPQAVMSNIKSIIGWRDCWKAYRVCQLFKDNFHPNSFPPNVRLAGLLDLEQTPASCEDSNIPNSMKSRPRGLSWLGCYHCFMPQRFHNFELLKWGNLSWKEEDDGEEDIVTAHSRPTTRRDQSPTPPSTASSLRLLTNPYYDPSLTRSSLRALGAGNDHRAGASQTSVTHRRTRDTWAIRRFCVRCGLKNGFYHPGDVIELQRPLQAGGTLWVCSCRNLLSRLAETTCSRCGMHSPLSLQPGRHGRREP